VLKRNGIDTSEKRSCRLIPRAGKSQVTFPHRVRIDSATLANATSPLAGAARPGFHTGWTGFAGAAPDLSIRLSERHAGFPLIVECKVFDRCKVKGHDLYSVTAFRISLSGITIERCARYR